VKKAGTIKKMRTGLKDIIQYFLPVGKDEIALNELLGKNIQLSYQHEINCIRCGKRTKTSFAQGYCYPCFITAPETEDCVLRPELCRAHEGIARDMEYAANHCLINHIVYLADSGGLKVGVTRNTQLFTRWIDQGASSVIRVAETPNRYIAGLIEVALKSHFTDKTNWRIMLTNKIHNRPGLMEMKIRAAELLPEDFKNYVSKNDEKVQLHYPVIQYPEKVMATGFDKNSVISGKLIGIRGQYMIFENGIVLNIRKYGGYSVEFES
jgi:hypothetical protein